MTATLTFVLVIIFIALIFDFSNGFHDAANSIATVVSTRVLSPGVAVVWAAFFNFIAFVIYGTRVAKAIGDGININLIARDDRLYVLLAALLGAGGILQYGPNQTLPAIPLWVVLIAHAAISLGTLSGGWRIVRTMGTRITKLKPVGGFCAETGAAITLAYVTLTGVPVSTTHTITGAIVGVGATRRLSAVKWGVAGRIVWAWILTIPLAGLISALCFMVYRALSHL